MPLVDQFKGRPRVVQTANGEKVLHGPLAFFGQGRDKQLYYIEVAQRIYVDPIPMGYQMASDRLAPKLNAPIFNMVKSKYFIAWKMPLVAYARAVHAQRREQFQDLEAEAQWKKIVEAADGVISMASLLMGPFGRLGYLVIAQALTTLAKATLYANQGDKAAWETLVRDDILDMLFHEVEMMLPSWARLAVQVKPYISGSYDALKTECTVHNVQGERQSMPRVPADIILNQIYRFQCIVDPTFQRQVQLLNNNISALKFTPPGMPSRQ